MFKIWTVLPISSVLVPSFKCASHAKIREWKVGTEQNSLAFISLFVDEGKIRKPWFLFICWSWACIYFPNEAGSLIHAMCDDMKNSFQAIIQQLMIFFSKCDIASMIDHIQMLKIHYQCCTFKCGRKGQGGSPDVEAISYESEGHLLGGLMIRVNWG